MCFSIANFLALGCGGSAQTLTCGQVTNGVIGFVGQINTYILSATAGDVIRFTALGTSGGICPDVEVTGPGGAIVGGFGCNDGFSTLRLPDTGIHTVRVRDRGNDQTGAYVLGLSFATPKCTAIALTCGQVVTNTFTNSVQQHTYSISGVAGDVIRLTSYPLAGAGPDIDVFNPSGALVTTFLYNDGLSTLKLATNGIYTLLVRDRGNDHTGAYVLSLVYATPKCAAIALSCGQVVTNTFSASVQQHTYSISGVAGDVIRLTSYPLAGAGPDIDVFNSTGDLVTRVGYNDGLSTLKLPTNGIYTLLVRDRGNDHTGAYVLSLVYATPKCAAIALSCGQVVTNTFSSFVQQHTYSISGVAGDVIRLTSYPLAGAGPDIDVFNSTGDLVTTFLYNDGLSTLKLPTNGNYTFLARDRGNNNTGAYVLSLVYATPKCAAIALSCGQVVTNTFSSSVQQHTYSISGVAGDVIRLTSYPLAGAGPDIDVFNPSGALVTTFLYNDGLSTLKLPTNGNYTLLARDRGNDHTGAYVLSLVYGTPQCTGIPLTCGDVVTNRFVSTVEQHTYTINGVAGDVIRLTSYPLAAAGPDLDVFNSAGVYLATIGYNDGLTTLKLTNTAPYTVVVRDRGNNNIGGYVLSLTYVTPKCSSLALNCGQGITNTFTSSVQQHTYVVNGYAGQAIRLIGQGSGVCPDMQVFNPAGTLIGAIGCNDPSSTVILPSTQSYRVVVRERGNDAVGKYSLFLDAIGGCFRLEVGSVVGRTQEVACLPLKTFAGAPAGALNFTLLAPSSVGGVPLSYSNVSLSTDSRFADATLTEGTAGTNVQWQVALRTGPVSPLIGDENIGSLCFRGISTQSVFVPFVLQSLTVSNLDGSVPGASALVGRAVIIADQPLLEAGLSPSQERLVTTYGKANTGYEIRYTSDVTTGRPWTLGMTNLLPASMFQTQPLPAPLTTVPTLFLHAKER